MRGQSILILLAGIALGFAAGYLVRESVPPGFGRPDAGPGEAFLNPHSGTGKSDGRSAPGSSVLPTGIGPAPGGDASEEEQIAYAERLAIRGPWEAIAWARENVEDESDIDEVMGAIAKIWAGEDPEAAFRWASELEHAAEKSDALAGVIEGAIESGQVDLAVEMIGRLPSGEFRDRAMYAAVKPLAELDTARAIELVESASGSNGFRYAGRILAKSYLDSEAGDAEELWTMIESLPFGGAQQQLAAALIEQVAEADPALAVEWLSRETDLLPEEVGRSVAYRIAREFTDMDRLDALAWADRIPGSRAKEYFLRTLGHSWARNEPDQAGNWLVALINDQGYDELEQVSRGLIGEWVDLDHEKPFEVIEKIQDPEARRSATLMAIEELSGTNPALAGDHLSPWIENGTPEAERLVGNLVKRWLYRDPEKATIWLDEQSAGPAKDRAIDVLVYYLLRENHDLEAAQAWIGEVQAEKTRERLSRSAENTAASWR